MGRHCTRGSPPPDLLRTVQRIRSCLPPSTGRYDATVTAAALILCATTETALADTGGRSAVRRMVESAWAGGAVPIVVLAPDPDGRVAEELGGSSALLAAPARVEGGPVGQILHGVRRAIAEVGDTDAVLIWPGRMAWVDPETVTSLLERHGIDAGAVLRPSFGDVGWPVLLPLAHVDLLARSGPERSPEDLLSDLEALGVPLRPLELGDPGTVHDSATPLDRQPTYEGPTRPAGGPPPEWGAPVGEPVEEAPLEGPSLAPYAQAESPEG